MRCARNVDAVIAVSEFISAVQCSIGVRHVPGRIGADEVPLHDVVAAGVVVDQDALEPVARQHVPGPGSCAADGVPACHGGDADTVVVRQRPISHRGRADVVAQDAVIVATGRSAVSCRADLDPVVGVARNHVPGRVRRAAHGIVVGSQRDSRRVGHGGQAGHVRADEVALDKVAAVDAQHDAETVPARARILPKVVYHQTAHDAVAALEREAVGARRRWLPSSTTSSSALLPSSKEFVLELASGLSR